MAVTYKWQQTDAPEDLMQRTVVETVDVPSTTKEEKFTVAQLEEQEANLRTQITALTAEADALLVKIDKVKTALKIV